MNDEEKLEKLVKDLWAAYEAAFLNQDDDFVTSLDRAEFEGLKLRVLEQGLGY